jgi:phosphatidate cytidylyltransferase
MAARGELAQRTGAALAGIPIALAILYAGGWILAGALALLAAIGVVEYFRLAERAGAQPLIIPGVAGAALLVLMAGFEPTLAATAPLLWGVAVVLLLVTAAAAIWVRGPTGRPLASVAATVTGAIFVGGTLVHGLLLRHLLATGIAPGAHQGRWAGTALVGFAVGLTWLNDSGAYFAGRALGRRKLIPSVSPGKTVEGAVAGISTAVVAGALYSAFILGDLVGLPVGLWEGAVGGVLIAVVAQVGDLVESLFKREAGVKDSGRLIPGHGGMLDRFDALFFALPVAYWYLSVILWLKGGGVVWQ